MWDRLNGLQSVQLFFTVGCSAAVPEAWARTTGCDWTGCSLKKYLWRNILTHISLTIRNCGTAFWLLNLSLLSFAVDANHAQGLSHQCKETQDLRKTVMQRNKSNCHCLRDSTSSMWRKQTTFLICSPKRTVLLRGTRDWWVVQASFIIINSIGLAPFPRLSDPPHSSHTILLFYLYFWSNKCILGEHMFLLKLFF